MTVLMQCERYLLHKHTQTLQREEREFRFKLHRGCIANDWIMKTIVTKLTHTHAHEIYFVSMRMQFDAFTQKPSGERYLVPLQVQTRCGLLFWYYV